MSQLGDAVRNSFVSAALGATIIAVVIGALSGVALARRPGRWTAVFLAVVFLILVTPEIMDAISLLSWMGKIRGPFTNDIGPFKYGLIRLWVGQSLYASAVVTLIVRARLAGLDEAPKRQLPPGRPAVESLPPDHLAAISSALVAGALLSFTLCLDNTVISALISGGGVSTFPVALLGATRSTIKPFWGWASVVLFMVTMASLGFVAQVVAEVGRFVVADRRHYDRRLTRRHAVVIVGAGFAGLTAARLLRAGGADVELIEGGPRAGGRARHGACPVRGRSVRRERRRMGRHRSSPHARAAAASRHRVAGRRPGVDHHQAPAVPRRRTARSRADPFGRSGCRRRPRTLRSRVRRHR